MISHRGTHCNGVVRNGYPHLVITKQSRDASELTGKMYPLRASESQSLRQPKINSESGKGRHPLSASESKSSRQPMIYSESHKARHPVDLSELKKSI